jgi:hypothetical protein
MIAKDPHAYSVFSLHQERVFVIMAASGGSGHGPAGREAAPPP